MMNLCILLVMFLYIGKCNARVVPLDFRPNESKQVDSSTSENELVEDSSNNEREILNHSLPDVKKIDDLEFLNFEDKNKSSLENSNSNASNLSLNATSEEKDIAEKSDQGKAESLMVSDLSGEEPNSASEFISNNDSDTKEPLKTPQINDTRNDEEIANLIVKNETFLANLSIGVEQGSNIEFARKEERIINDTLDNRNETSAIFEIFEDTNTNSSQLQPISNETEVEVALFKIENITDHVNETSTLFEVFDVTNNTDNFQLQSISNDTDVDIFLNDAENITEDFRLNNVTSENMDLQNDSVQTEGGIFSGFEFLINSEVARNAAKAMEVFNFSDSLTDHIMEENEFHSFLPSFHAEQDFGFTNGTDSKNEISITNLTGEPNEIQTDLNISIPSVEQTFIGFSQGETFEIKNLALPINLDEPLKERNETELFNLIGKLEGNATSEVSSNSEKPDGSLQLASEAVTPKESTNETLSHSTAVGVPDCPPPGWCVFWFLSQDTCAVNEHCLGSRICCKIRCSKTCIEVESL